MAVKCPYCGKDTEYVDSIVVYKVRSYGMIYLCRDCDAFVGVHKGTSRPLGTPAKEKLRKLRHLAHKEFQRIEAEIERHNAYKWLARAMDLTRDETHMGLFDEQMCMKAIRLMREWKEKNLPKKETA